MRKTMFLLGAGIAMCVVVSGQPASMQSPAPERATPAEQAVVDTPTRTVANVPMPTLTPAEQAAVAALVMAVRRDSNAVSQLAQRAARDAAEGLYREPTAAEAAVLGSDIGDEALEELELPGGASAVSPGAVGVSHLMASVDEKGRLVMNHEAASARKGQRRDQ